ncbi:MAG: S-layer homology domain-containing protein [Firmicutes bacterium]|nr:S-layer homology domain-containing protein [Bacillota bacterium]
MKKRSFLLCTLILALMLAFAAPLSAAQFTDVPENEWFAEDVYALVGADIISGYPDGTYLPKNEVKRGEFAKILAFASYEDMENYSEVKLPFTDSQNHWAKSYIAWAYEHKIVYGRSDTAFDPDGIITRQEMAVMIDRFADYKEFTLPEKVKAVEFTDANLIGDYAKDAVAAMQKAQIINGYPDGSFAPTKSANRAEAAKMINTLFQTMTYIIDLDAEDNKTLERNNMTFTVPVEIRGDNGVASFNNCEFMWDITYTAKEGTRVIIDQQSVLNGNVIFKNGVKEADMNYDMPKVFSETNIRAIAENCIGTVVTFGGASLNYNGTDYTISDCEWFEDANGISKYTGQEANSLYIGQWWENGEKFIFKLCFE